MKKDRIIIYPSLRKSENKYINNLYETIKEEYNVCGYIEAKNEKKKFKADIYHFNWYESVSGKKIKIQYIKKKLFVIVLKLLNKKIIWTVHNNSPHEIKNKKETINFMKFMAKKSDKIHVLCKETMNNEYLEKYKAKIVCIPHGDYIGNYPESNIDIYERYNIPRDKQIMLFIGQVRKYKNIELLIKAFKNSNIEDSEFVLLICGSCNSEEYKKELNELSNDNIFFDFNFIKDEEIEAYLRNSKIIVAPYNKESSLNSGTLWMAMSYHKTMMLPLIGCVKDIENFEDYLYVYDYNNQENHYEELLKCMERLNQDLKNNENILEEKGNKAYDYMIDNQTWNFLKEKWLDLYKF
jgi:glycosyltransferase involved in cell wall biosynthesis